MHPKKRQPFQLVLMVPGNQLLLGPKGPVISRCRIDLNSCLENPDYRNDSQRDPRRGSAYTPDPSATPRSSNPSSLTHLPQPPSPSLTPLTLLASRPVYTPAFPHLPPSPTFRLPLPPLLPHIPRSGPCKTRLTLNLINRQIEGKVFRAAGPGRVTRKSALSLRICFVRGPSFWREIHFWITAAAVKAVYAALNGFISIESRVDNVARKPLAKWGRNLFIICLVRTLCPDFLVFLHVIFFFFFLKG